MGADGTVVGVVSEADLLHKQSGRRAPHNGAVARFRAPVTDVKTRACIVGEAMTTPAITVGPESTWRQPRS